MTKEDPQSCVELERVCEASFKCEVCGKHEASLICGFCGKRVCGYCMSQKPRACCHREPKGWNE